MVAIATTMHLAGATAVFASAHESGCGTLPPYRHGSPPPTIARSLANYGHDRFAIALAAPTAASDAAEIKVLISRAMNHVLTEIAGAFQRTSEHKVVLILAPPAEIRRRIINGEMVDVTMSGDAIIWGLVQQGKIARDARWSSPASASAWRFARDRRSWT
jgi:ABC-type molybdate transport system substrate-binding protein